MSVSVVIPTYNRVHFLVPAIESALSQTVRPDEIVVVDDGSTDNTAEALKRFGNIIRYVRQENGGAAKARNTGIEACKSKYIAFLDSDDLWLPDKLAAQTAILDRYADVGYVFSEFRVLKDDGHSVENGSRQWLPREVAVESLFDEVVSLRESGGDPTLPDAPVRLGRLYRHMIDHFFMLTSSLAVRRDALDPTIRFGEKLALFEDWEFVARLSRQWRAAFIDAPTTINRGHKGPERLTRITSKLAKARSYVAMLERVWMSDRAFVSANGQLLQEARERAWLALAREALLASKPREARGALEALTRSGAARKGGTAALYSLCAAVPAGGSILKLLRTGQHFGRVLTGRDDSAHPVNPAA